MIIERTVAGDASPIPTGSCRVPGAKTTAAVSQIARDGGCNGRIPAGLKIAGIPFSE